jgi:hypothetical protein
MLSSALRRRFLRQPGGLQSGLAWNCCWKTWPSTFSIGTIHVSRFLTIAVRGREMS